MPGDGIAHGGAMQMKSMKNTHKQLCHHSTTSIMTALVAGN